jgi:hypothetical protein
MAMNNGIPDKLTDFVAQCGWHGAMIEPLAGDASFRRYFRVTDDSRQAILMDAPPPEEDPRPFIHVAEELLALGFATPAILGKDLAQGLVLIEDFGDERMREYVDARPDRETDIYSGVVDVLLSLHQHPAITLPPYDLAMYQREAGFLTEWYCPAMGLDCDIPGYASAWEKVLPDVLAAQSNPVTVLRDYHAENIMLLPDGGFGLLDFQDALAGHPAYDLVSMLQDARRDVAPDLEARMLARYLDQMSGISADRFRSHYAILGAQRNAKIIGIFTRLWRRDGKPRYLSFIPRMWGLLERDLAHPDLAPVARWFEENIPPDVRARAVQDQRTDT